MRKKYLLAIFVILLCVRFSFSIEPVNKETDIVIDITAGYIFYDGKCEELKREHPFTFRKNEIVAILVKKNPLRFDQKLKSEKRTKTENYQVAEEFAKKLGELIAILGVPEDPSHIHRPDIRIPGAGDRTIKGLSDEFMKHIEVLKKHLAEIDGLIAQSKTPTGVDTVKNKVAGWENVHVLKNDIESVFKEMDEILSDFSMNDWGNDPDPKNLRDITHIQSHLLYRESIQEMLKTLISFVDDVNHLNEYVELATVAYSSSEKITITIEILGKDGVVLTEDEKNKKIGDFEFIFSPYRSVNFGFAPAFVYSFVRDRSFTTEETSGGFKIVESTDDKEFSGLNVAAMFTIAPKFLENFGGYGEIGFNPIKDKVALFVGGGITFSKLFSVGMGLTYQQISKLEDGLKVDDILESADDLKIGKEFKFGVYLRLAVDLSEIVQQK